MRVLALDTATAATAVAIHEAGGPAAVEKWDWPAPGARPNHARAVLGLVEQALQDAGGGWEAIDRIAVGLGPGTFVGLRIGVATAQGLARARGIPLVGVSTLGSLALGAESEVADGQRVLAVIDARRGEAFVGGDGRDARVVAPEALELVGAGTLAVGDGAIKFREQLESGGATVPEDDSLLHRVRARWHCQLAVTIEPGALSAIQPQYIRVPDAELNR